MGKYQRTKGHNFERLIAIILRPLWPEAKRGLQSQSYVGKPPDVDETPYYIECKKGARTNIKAAIRQAQDNTDGRPVLAITRDDKCEILVTMTMDTFLKIGGYIAGTDPS